MLSMMAAALGLEAMVLLIMRLIALLEVLYNIKASCESLMLGVIFFELI